MDVPAETFDAPESGAPTVRRPRWLAPGAVVVTVAIVVGGLGLVVDGARTLADDGPSYAHLVLRTGSVPAPLVTTADVPTPGFEESGAPLGDVPPVAEPDDTFTYQLTQDGPAGAVPVRWSPCRPVHVVVHPDGAPPDFTAQVLEALGAVSAATGLVFTLDGLTKEPPDPARAPFLPARYGDRWAPVVIAFADRTAIPDLGGGTLGITSVHTRTAPDGTTSFVSGSVYLDTQLLGMRGIGGRPAHVPVLLHELGHLVGLDHVDDAGELMSATVGPVGGFGDGDRTGLAQLGAGPCAPEV